MLLMPLTPLLLVRCLCQTEHILICFTLSWVVALLLQVLLLLLLLWPVFMLHAPHGPPTPPATAPLSLRAPSWQLCSEMLSIWLLLRLLLLWPDILIFTLFLQLLPVLLLCWCCIQPSPLGPVVAFPMMQLLLLWLLLALAQPSGIPRRDAYIKI